jgi:hypothetical protein
MSMRSVVISIIIVNSTIIWLFFKSFCIWDDIFKIELLRKKTKNFIESLKKKDFAENKNIGLEIYIYIGFYNELMR